SSITADLAPGGSSAQELTTTITPWTWSHYDPTHPTPFSFLTPATTLALTLQDDHFHNPQNTRINVVFR
ncbi:hypothetical protein KUCAC02_014299, partial [Chaenocephalus aceratus]